MPIEIEAKLKVDDLGPVRARLKGRSAALLGEYIETNTFFDTEDRSLTAAGKGLRLRRNHDVATGQDQFILTYKGPRRHGPLKSREEQELAVGAEADAILLLQRLGYGVILQFEKRRQSWSLDDCKVELDELPHLGPYVEIEGPSEESILAVRDTLGLTHHPLVKPAYATLLLAHLEKQANPTRVIAFPPSANHETRNPNDESMTKPQ